MQFKLNGQEVHYTGDPELSLLNYLRDQAGITSPKDGCSPQAACGCCAIQIDDKAMLSCVTPMKKVAGSHVITTEGMGEYHRMSLPTPLSKRGASSVVSVYRAL